MSRLGIWLFPPAIFFVAWTASGSRDPAANKALFFLCVIALAQTAVMELIRSQADRQQKVLTWFAKHIKIDPNSVPDDMPEDLRSLMGKE